MKNKEKIRALKFVLFSISAGIIQILADTICLEVFHMPAWLSYFIALVLSVLWNFTFNRKYTFRSANNVPKAMALVALFYLVFTPLSTWWTDVLVVNCGINEYIVLIGTMIINFVTEFLYDTFVVFRGTIDTNEQARKELEREA